MEVKNAVAGTLESGDIMIQIAPAETKGLHIDLDSSVAAQFGRQIRLVIEETLKDFGLEDADIKAVDEGPATAQFARELQQQLYVLQEKMFGLNQLRLWKD